MFKKYRKLTAIVLSLALIFTGTAFGTINTTADDWTEVPNATLTDVGPWTLWANYAEWAKLAYKTTGDEVGDTTIRVVNPTGWYNWNCTATLKNYVTGKMVVGRSYSMSVNITSTKATASGSSIKIQVDQVDYLKELTASTQTLTLSSNYTYTGTTPNVVLDLSLLTAGTDITVNSITFTDLDPTTQAPTEEPTTADPTVPQNVAAYNYYANEAGYQIKFNEVTGADSYKVYMDDSASLATITESGAFIPASTFSTYADDELHSLYLTSVTGGVESGKSSAASVRVMTKTNSDSDPTDIPRVYIVTNKGTNSSITKESKTPCSLTVKGGQDGVLSAFGDGTVKLRGNSTKFADKKAYNISFNTKQSLMNGRNKGKKWCLLAAAYDKSILRTKVGMHLGQIFDNVASPEDHYVEVYLNGTLMGLYDMCEPADNGRSGIDYDDSASSEEIMFELENGKTGNTYDRDELQDGAMYHNTKNTNIRFVTEDLEDEVSALVAGYTETYNYNTYLNKLDTDLASNTKYTSWKSVLDAADLEIRNYGSDKVFNYIDLDSFVDMYIINEVMNTVDFNYSSVKFYTKMVNGQLKIYAGCIWDFDLSSGNSYYSAYRHFKQMGAVENPWFRYLVRNTKFMNAVKARFKEKARSVVNLYYTNVEEGYGTSYIDQMTTYMQQPRIRNYSTAGWDEGTPDSYDVYSEPDHKWAYSYGCVTEGETGDDVVDEGAVYANYTYADHVSYLKSFLSGKVQWLFDYWQCGADPVMTSSDLDITGYQMTATAGDTHDKVGFRNVFQFEPTVNGENYVKKGLVYGIKYGSNPISADDVYVGSPAQVTIGGQTVDAVKNYDSEDEDQLDYQAGTSKTAEYYAQTMENTATVTAEMYTEASFIVRAYVQTEGGTYIYSKPYEYKYYDVADYLYQNNMFTNQLSHNLIYQNVLHFIDPTYVAIDFDWGNIVVKP